MAYSASANTPLLPVTGVSTRKPKWRFTCCIRSKAARLVLLWNFAVLLLYRILYNIDVVMQVSGTSSFMLVSSIILLFIAVFSPVAGLLTDIRFSRYRAVVYSSWFFIVKIVCVLVLAILSLLGLYFYSSTFIDTKNKISTFLVTLYSMLAVFLTIDSSSMHFSLAWISFMTHPQKILYCSYIGMCGYTMPALC